MYSKKFGFDSEIKKENKMIDDQKGALYNAF